MSVYPNFNLDIPKMGYFILYKHEKGFIGNCIRAKQLKAGFSEEDSQYTHIEVSGGGQESVCVAPPKTRVVDITKKYKGRYVKIVKYNASDYNTKRYKIAFWSATHCNLPYDFLGIAAFITKVFKHVRNWWFCAEDCLWCLQKQYVNAFEIEPDKCMPARFLGNGTTVVWEGIINYEESED